MKVTTTGWALLIFFGVLFLQLFTDAPIFPIFIGIVFLLIILIRFNIFSTSNSSNYKMSKATIIKIKEDLNINATKWKTLTNQEKQEMYWYSQKQSDLIKRIIRTKSKKNSDLDKVKSVVEKEWKSYSLEKRISLIEEEDVRLEYLKKARETKLKNKKKKKEDLERKILSEKKQKEEQEARKIAEEREKNEEKERVERKIFEENKRQELLIERKKQKEKNYKESIKRQLLEKEKRIQIESDAIQELIADGKLSENYSKVFNRISIPSHIKEAVWKRDKQSCVNCGSQDNLEFDHNIPVSKGGSNTINNIQILCQKCNRKKSNKIM